MLVHAGLYLRFSLLRPQIQNHTHTSRVQTEDKGDGGKSKKSAEWGPEKKRRKWVRDKAQKYVPTVEQTSDPSNLGFSQQIIMGTVWLRPASLA